MKRNSILLAFLAFTYAGFSQTTKALVYTNSSPVQIADFNLETADLENLQTVNSNINLFVPKDFIYDQKHGSAVYQDRNNGLVFCSIDPNGKVTSKNSVFNTNVMAPAYIPSEQKVACFNVQKEFNGYGNNEDNLFFSIVDVNNGFIKNQIKFSELSFNNVVAPFYGTTLVADRFSGIEVAKEVSMSKPIYIAEKGLYIALMGDVTGTNRLYKIKVNSPKAMVSKNRCNYNIIDMAHVKGTNTLKTLFFEEVGSNYRLKVGDLDFETNEMTNISTLADVTSTNSVKIDNGSIEFNLDQSQLFVTYFTGISTMIFNMDQSSNKSKNTTVIPQNIQFNFGFNEEDYKPLTYTNVYKLYPNPSTGIVSFKNQTGNMPNSLIVYNNVGQVVKNISVLENVSVIDIDLSDMTPGVYYVKADMVGEDFVGKVIVTK